MAGRDLGFRSSVNTAAPAIDNSGLNPFGNGFWVARFDPNALPRIPFEIWRMTTRGPSGIGLQVYVDTRLVTGTLLGTLNEWTASGDAIPVDSGQSVIVYWNSSTAPAPFLSLYMRER